MSLATSFHHSFARAVSAVFPAAQLAADTVRSGERTFLWVGAPQLAKQLKLPAKAIADSVAAAFRSDEGDITEVQANGMIPVAVRVDAIARRLTAMHNDERLGVPLASPRKRVVIDFSSPNVAKELHVGHLRSTIIGESLARLQEFLGHDLLRLNHVGDWGTQFGMLICYLREQKIDVPSLTLPDLMICYRASKKFFDVGVKFEKTVEQVRARLQGQNVQAAQEAAEEDAPMEDVQESAAKEIDAESIMKEAVAHLQAEENPPSENHIRDVVANLMQGDRAALEFAKRARQAVVHLQGGDPESLAAWQQICDVSRIAYRKIYDLLDITITDRGESYYNPLLGPVVEDLLARKIAKRVDGAACVEVAGHAAPFRVQKSDGGYTYDTTDIAALQHRVNEEKAERIIYVVDAGQSDHFDQLKKVGIQAGYLDPNKTEFRHVEFGVVLGPDKQKYKTRSGDVALLNDLLQEAIQMASKTLHERGIDDPESSKTLGMGALKYADLKNARHKNYEFNSDRMLNLEGDTIAYIQYALVRLLRIKEKSSACVSLAAPFNLTHPVEQELGLHLLSFPDVIARMDQTLEPHLLCKFVHTLASKFNTFYKDCQVNEGNDQASRLRLCDLTERVIKQSLFLLGIRTLQQM